MLILWGQDIELGEEHKDLEQRLLLEMLKLDKERLKIQNRWIGHININEQIQRITVEARKAMRNTHMLLTAGQKSEYDRNYLPGTVSISMSRVPNLKPADLVELSLVTEEMQVVYYNTINTYKF